MIFFVIILLSIIVFYAIHRALFELPFGNYIIKKGKHYAEYLGGFGRLKVFCISSKNYVNWLHFSADVTYGYYNLDLGQQAQINKIFGYSLNLFKHHHDGSIRIGWRLNQFDADKVEIMAYYYDNKIRKEESLGYVEILGNTFSIDIKMCTSGCQHLILFQGKYTSIFVSQKAKKYGWVLLPYFGGKTVAPHDIKIKICNRDYQ